MNIKTIIGWVLLVIGLVIIGQAINLSYQYFTAKANFPELFKTSAINQNQPAKEAQQISSSDSVLNSLDNLPEQIQPTIDQTLNQADNQINQAMTQAANMALANIMPADSTVKLLNLIAWSIFAAFLVYTGGTIASLGIKLLLSKSPA